MSAVDKKNVLDTWNVIYKDWDDANGVTFYNRLFSNNPKIKATFINPDIKKRSKAFGDEVNSWIENLDNADTLDQMIGEMCDSHTKKGITDIELFKDALTEVSNYVNDTLGMNAEQQKSWQQINDVFLDIIKSKF